MSPHAVIVGLDSITGLQSARILAARGVPVIALAGDTRHFCCRTRVCERIVAADTKTDAFLEPLARVGERLEQKAVLYPCTDAAVLSISRHRSELEPWFHVVLPEPDVVEMLIDKIAFYAYANEHELPIPQTFLLQNRDDAEAAAGALTYPAIVKPPLRTPEWERETNQKAYRVDDGPSLLALYDVVGAWADVLVAQEWVDGGDADLYSCNCYYGADGRALATFVARKLRQWPPRTGTSSLGEECRNDVVLAETLRLFDGVGFRGLGYVEMKRDARTGRHSIIEPNIGRPTGRSAIAERGGVELLYTMYCDALGLPLPENREQRYVGAKWIDHRRDFQSAFFYWRHGELTLREWARSWQGPKASAVVSRSDPLPFVMELWQSMGKAVDLLVDRTQTRARPGRPAGAKVRKERAGPPPLALEPLRADADDLREWDELAARTRNVFATSEWLLTWWRHFGRDRRLLLTAARDDDGRLRALLPLYLASERPVRVARLLGHGAGDELGPVCAAEDRRAVADALGVLLRREHVHVVLAEQLPAPAHWSRLLGGRVLGREGSPVLRFDGLDWDGFLGTLSSGLRQELRYHARRLARRHEVSYRLVETPAGLDEELETLFELHAAQWEAADKAFVGERRDFHRDFASAALARGWLRLWFLEVDGRPVAAKYNFRFGDVEFSYQAGRDPAWRRSSVGVVLLAHVMRQALEDGVAEYRFLRGSEPYKYRFTKNDPGLETILLGRGAIGAAAARATALLHDRRRLAALRRYVA